MSKIKVYKDGWQYASTKKVPKIGLDFWNREDQATMFEYADLELGKMDEQITFSISLSNGVVPEGITVSYINAVSGTLRAQWEGSELVFTAKKGEQYHFLVDGTLVGLGIYTTPTYTALSGNNRTINIPFEVGQLKVNVTGLNDWFEISVKEYRSSDGYVGSTLGVSRDNEKTFQIQAGMEVAVFASPVINYTTPETQYTVPVSGSTVSVTMAYTFDKTSGVFIHDTSGRYWNASDWDSSATADCIAVVSEAHRFGIALTESKKEHSLSEVYMPNFEDYLTAYDTEDSAKADYNGKKNTANMLKVQSSTEEGAGWCNKYIFPSGKNGYLGSAGEWNLTLINLTAISDALNVLGETSLVGPYWTSTFYGINTGRYFWRLYLSISSFGKSCSYSSNYCVRAFCEL